MLEYGCGTAFPLSHMFAGYFQVRCATDIDPIKRSLWPEGVEFRRSEGGTLPFAGGQFDAVMILSVLEHVEDPAACFGEIARVLKPGGRVFVSLPNKWDYVSVVARLAGGFKASFLHHLLKPTWADYPVHYRCNTRRALARFASEQGLAVELFRPWPSEPAYLSFFVPLYLLGAVYQFGISLCGLDALQPAFIAVLRKGHPTERAASRFSRARGRGSRVRAWVERETLDPRAGRAREEGVAIGHTAAVRARADYAGMEHRP